jgi:flagellar biosynthesis protein FliR
MTKKGTGISFKTIWAVLMVAIYLMVAYMLVFSPFFHKSTISKEIRIGIAIIFALYGLYRGYRLVKK